VASDGVFQGTFGSGSQAMADMLARYEDPQQRAKMRDEQRQSTVDSHYGVADTLQLDAAAFDELIDLFTDQQMERRSELLSRVRDTSTARRSEESDAY
jgi:hypothetical protein